LIQQDTILKFITKSYYRLVRRVMRYFFFAAIFLCASFAQAEPIGTVETKGLFFKDTLTVEAFDDPTISGVTCYTTIHDKAMSFEESSSVSLSCRQVGPIKGELVSQPNVFSRSKNPFFKKTVVDRFWDAKRKVLIYLTYTKATSGTNASNSVSVVVVRP